MKIRITSDQLPYYTQVKRDGTTLLLHGQNWLVIGVTADTMNGAAWAPAMTTYRPQYWVEMIEA
jgi:hypothetical protein